MPTPAWATSRRRRNAWKRSTRGTRSKGDQEGPRSRDPSSFSFLPAPAVDGGVHAESVLSVGSTPEGGVPDDPGRLEPDPPARRPPRGVHEADGTAVERLPPDPLPASDELPAL